MPSRSSRIGRGLDVLLVLVATLGLLVLVARIAGAALGLDLVTFATGSMSPAYPQGSVAVAQRTPLSNLRVGDVVMVDRAGALPITHRIVAIRPAGGGAVLRLRGDANRLADPRPYAVDAASRIVAALPAPLAVLRWLGRPQSAAAGALLAAGAVVWGMWPTRRRPTATAAREAEAA